MTRARDPGAYVLVFFLCFFAILSSGRIASLDAGHQLQAAVMFVLTGHLGDDGRSGGPANEAWVRAPNGRSYQAHDPGNLVMMLPAAWIGARLSPAGASEDMRDPPALSRVLVSLTCAAMAALGCYWMFRVRASFQDPRPAFLLTLLLPAATIYVAYARAAWDVLGGAVFMCGVLYSSAAVLRRVAPERNLLLLAATLAAACTFRYSLAPFIVPAAAAIVFAARRVLDVRSIVRAALLFAALVTPTLAYNFVRTGSPFMPATASPQYLHGTNALTGDVDYGLYGLWLSPNRGLLLFSPMLALAFAVPFVWTRLAKEERTLLAAYGAGAFAYTLLIARMANWGAFGWGPRYLVPILPVIFAAAAAVVATVSRRASLLVAPIVIASIVLTVPPAVVNWHLATTSYDGAADPDAAYPYQQIGAWRALAGGLAGTPLPVPEYAADDPLRATTSEFPDLLLVRVARHSRAGLALALVAAALAIAIMSVATRRILREGERIAS